MANNTNIVIGPHPGWFTALIEPKPNLNNELKYSIQVVLDKKKNKGDIEKVKKTVAAAAKKAIADGKFPKSAVRSYISPLRDGDKEGKERYEGVMFLNANSTRPPGVIDINGERIINDDDVYSGAIYRTQINFYPSTKGAPRICAGLQNVMKIEDGERLDGAEPPEKAFASYIEEDGGDDDGVFDDI